MGHLALWCPRDLVITSAQHDCPKCRKDCKTALSALAPPGSHDTHRVMERAVRLVGEDGVPSRPARWHLWRDPRVCVCPVPRSKTGSRRGENKAPARRDTDCRDWALADAAGDVAAAALSDGPGCLLSVVDKRCAKRLLDDV